MDPSNFGSFSSGGNSGGANGINVPNNGVTSGANPTVNSSQVNPGQAQGFVGAQPVRPAQPVVSGPTQQPRTVQSPMQQPMQFQPQMVASGTGDILISSSQRKSPPKKKFIVSIVIVLVLIVIVSVVTFLWSNNVDITKSSTNIEDSFNRYANYYFYGDEKDDDSWREFDSTKMTSYYYTYLQSADTYLDLFAKLKEKYKLFQDKIKSEFKSDLYDESYIDYYGMLLDFVAKYYTEQPLTRVDILNAYLNGGEESANKYIKESASQFEDIGNFSDLNYYDLSLKWGNENLLLIKLYERQGCLTLDSIDYSCAAIQYNESNEIISQEITTINKYMDMIISNSNNDLEEYIYYIGDLVEVLKNNSGERK